MIWMTLPEACTAELSTVAPALMLIDMPAILTSHVMWLSVIR